MMIPVIPSTMPLDSLKSSTRDVSEATLSLVVLPLLYDASLSYLVHGGTFIFSVDIFSVILLLQGWPQVAVYTFNDSKKNCLRATSVWIRFKCRPNIRVYSRKSYIPVKRVP
jgi:hypothetical protein